MNHVCNIHSQTVFYLLVPTIEVTLVGRIGFFEKSVMVDADMGCGDQAFACQ